MSEIKESVPQEEPVSDLIASISSPISADEPSGENVRYDDDFEAAKAEFEKLSEIDYEMIGDVCTELLATKTKDVLVASYLAVALTARNELIGLAEGILVLQIMVDNFWETILPPKPVAKSNAIKFFAQKTSGFLEKYKPGERDRLTVALVLERLTSFQSFITENMGDHAPPLSGLLKVISDIERRLPKIEVEKKGGPGPAGPAVPVEQAEIQSPVAAAAAIVKGATFLRESNPTSPVPYKILRGLRWGPIVTAPPNENGKTKVAGPIPQRKTFLTGLVEDPDQKKLITEAENTFADGSFNFWIDLQYLIAGAMTKLGESYDSARQVILEETALLLNRVPELVDLTFADGSPFVGPECADWLEKEVRPLFSSFEDDGDMVSDNEQLESQKKEAQKLLKKGKVQDAIRTMREGADLDRTTKDKFLRQLYTANLCLAGDRPIVARAILEKMAQAAERHDLAGWDPQLTIAVLSSLRTCYIAETAKAIPADKAFLVKRGEEVFESICKIDPEFAVSLS